MPERKGVTGGPLIVSLHPPLFKTVSGRAGRVSSPAHVGNSEPRQALARLVDSPLLARVVPHLAPETLHQLIQHQGLHACGELVTSATPAQLTSLLDLDLWRHPQPGRDEQFDVGRSANGLKCWSTPESRWPHARLPLSTKTSGSRPLPLPACLDPGTFEPTSRATTRSSIDTR